MPDTWRIYYIENCHQSIPPKDKLVAIVCKDSKLMGFLINSNVHPFIQKRPQLLVCQVVIEKSNYRFLSKDSYIDCIDLYEFEDTELVDSRGAIYEQTKAEIKKAVNNSKTIEERYKKLILGK